MEKPPDSDAGFILPKDPVAWDNVSMADDAALPRNAERRS